MSYRQQLCSSQPLHHQQATPTSAVDTPTHEGSLPPRTAEKGTPFVKQYLAEKLRCAQDRIQDLEEQLADATSRLRIQQGSFEPIMHGAREISSAGSQDSAPALHMYMHDLEVDNQFLRESLFALRRKMQQPAAGAESQQDASPSGSQAVREAARDMLLKAMAKKRSPVASAVFRAPSPITRAPKRTGISPIPPTAVSDLIITSGVQPPETSTVKSTQAGPQIQAEMSTVTPGIFFRSLGRAARAADVCSVTDRRRLESAFDTAQTAKSAVSPTDEHPTVSTAVVSVSLPPPVVGFIESAFQAVKAGDTVGLEAALSKGLDVDVYSKEGQPLLVAAAAAGNAQAVSWLLELGADPCATDSREHGPLTAAMHARAYAVASELIKAGVQW